MNDATDFPSSPRQESFESFRPEIAGTSTGDGGAGPSDSHEIIRRKKRRKMCRFSVDPSDSALRKPKPWKKPEPIAPKIARPCSECGKQFSSWKALFGHMRCHPERTWRGINPPINSRRPSESTSENPSSNFTDEDHEVATCLVLLSNGPFVTATTAVDTPCSVIVDRAYRDCNEALISADVDGLAGPSGLNCRFECSSCKRVFGSHQALGGHRASHKNVKGCFAIGDHGHDRSGEGDSILAAEDRIDMVLGHQSSSCMRLFSSSAQALDAQRRCHLEKGKVLAPPQGLSLNPFRKKEDHGDGLDLNLPAPLETDASSSSSSTSSSGLVLDLRLGV